MNQKSFKKAAIIVLTMMMVCLPVCGTSAASAGSNMTNLLKSYRNGNYAKAERYGRKLSKKAKEACVKKMPKGMKAAYRSVVKRWKPLSSAKAGKPFLWGYYLTDIDNDKKAELLVEYGTCEADVRVSAYKYKGGKAKKLGTVFCDHSSFYAYPGHRGVVIRGGHMGVEWLDVLLIKNGRLVRQSYGSRQIDPKTMDWLTIGQELNYHIKYGKNYRSSVDYRDLK